MQNELDGQLTKETICCLARANGLNIPEERLERVLAQYKIYLDHLARLDSLPLEMAAEPATVFSPTISVPGSESGEGPETSRKTK